MSPIIIRYITKKFLTIFGFSLFALVFLFINIDLIENVDRFIDRNVSWQMTAMYYLYFIPSVIIMILPAVSMLAAVFSIGFMARYNEIVALKSLGMSLYQMMAVLLSLSLLICLGSFLISEILAPKANKKKEQIVREYLKRNLQREQLRSIEIQEPDGMIVTIKTYNTKTKTALQVKTEKFEDGKLIERMDTPKMVWDTTGWIISQGVIRYFDHETETVHSVQEEKKLDFHFSPEDFKVLMMKPEELGFWDLYQYIKRMRKAGNKVHKWLTDFHVRFAFPMANFFVVLLSAPLAYNRRQKSLALGFIICLLIGFLYFGLIQTGQSLGHHNRVPPFIAAWTGNIIALGFGLLNLRMTRK